jgi:hypothetical protein
MMQVGNLPLPLPILTPALHADFPTVHIGIKVSVAMIKTTFSSTHMFFAYFLSLEEDWWTIRARLVDYANEKVCRWSLSCSGRITKVVIRKRGSIIIQMFCNL